MLWLPVKILQTVWPSFLPYTVILQNESQYNELPLDFPLLHVRIFLLKKINELPIFMVFPFSRQLVLNGYSSCDF